MTTPFVGRAHEIAVLTTQLAQAREGRGGFVLLHGEPGIGKTRLADRASMLASEIGFSVHWGSCWSGDGAPAFWPWLSLLRSCCGTSAGEMRPARIAWATELVDAFLEQCCSSSAAELEHAPRRDRFQFFQAVATVLDARAAAQPLLLVLDDIHEADEESLELLRFVARESCRRRVLVVATCRDAFAGGSSSRDAAFAALSRQSTRIPLAGLASGEVDELLDAIGEGRLQPRLREVVKAASDGNPFFADELVRVVLARPALREGAPIPVPFTVKEALRERLAPFDSDTRALLGAAATIGRDFSERVLCRVVDLPRETCRARLASVAHHGLVEEGEDGSWRFVHVLVRETLREDLDPSLRRRLHLRIAAEMASDRDGQRRGTAAEKAHHLLEARPLSEAETVAEALLEAARESSALLAHEAAAAQLGAAVDVLQDETGNGPREEPERIASLLIDRGQALRAAGRLSRARETFLLAASMLRPLLAQDRAATANEDAVALFAQAALGFGGVSETGQVDGPLVALLEEALAAHLHFPEHQAQHALELRRPDFQGATASPVAARLLARLAMALYFATDSRRCVRVVDEAVAMAERCGDARARVEALVARHFVLWRPGTAAVRLAVAEELLRQCEAGREPEAAAEARLCRIADLLELGEAELAEAEARRYEADADARRLPVPRWHAALLRANFAAMRGNTARALRDSEEALAIGSDAELPNARAFHLAQIFQWSSRDGSLAQLEPALRAAAAAQPAMAIWTACAAEAAAAAGHEDLARSDYASLREQGFAAVARDGMWVSTMAVLVRLAARFGDREGAACLHDLLLPHRDEWVVAVGAIACPGPVRFFLAIARATLGDVVAAATELRSVADDTRASGYHGIAECCEAELAALRSQQGDPSPPAPPCAARGEFRRSADFWTLAVGDESLRLRDSKGLRYIHFLLEHPGRELHVFDLVAAVDGSGDEAPSAAGESPGGDRARDSGPLADASAMRAYRRRLRELDAELAEAEANHDGGRLESLHEERDFLARELASVAGLGGRPRRAGSPSEQVRVRVTKVIGLAMRRISGASPAVGRALSRGIRTGTFCCYRPDPDRLLEWSTGGD